VSRDLESLLRFAPDGSSDRLASLRREALAQFEEQGLPTRRLENWKGTSLVPLERLHFERVGPGAKSIEPETGAFDLVFVDGRLDSAASDLSALPAGIRVTTLLSALEEEPERVSDFLGRLAEPKRHALIALQTAFLEDGAFVSIDPGTKTVRPLRIRFVSTSDTDLDTEAEAASASFPRLLVVAGEDSAATIFQAHDSIGSAAGLTATVSEIFLARGAHVEFVQLQSEGAARVHFTSLHARVERDARFSSNVYTLGEGLVRSEAQVELAEPGARAELNGLFLGRGKGHVDHFTTVDHAAEDCESDEEYRGVLGDHSRGVFRGRVIVRPDAQRTDARQSNPNLLLSDHANIDTKPQLEIYADDVRASHGATIGQLDEDALFFLRARGIGESSARLLLTNAFAQSIVERIDDQGVRDLVREHVESTLDQFEGAARRDGERLR